MDIVGKVLVETIAEARPARLSSRPLWPTATVASRPDPLGHPRCFGIAQRRSTRTEPVPLRP